MFFIWSKKQQHGGIINTDNEIKTDKNCIFIMFTTYEQWHGKGKYSTGRVFFCIYSDIYTMIYNTPRHLVKDILHLVI